MKVRLDIDEIGFDYPIMEKSEGKIINIPCIPVVGMFIDIEHFFDFTEDECNSFVDGMCVITEMYIEPDYLTLKLERIK